MANLNELWKKGSSIPLSTDIPEGGLAIDTTSKLMYSKALSGDIFEVSEHRALVGGDDTKKFKVDNAVGNKEAVNKSQLESGLSVKLEASNIKAGSQIGVSVSGNDVTLNHGDTSTKDGWQQATNKTVDKIKVDSNGHIVDISFKAASSGGGGFTQFTSQTKTGAGTVNAPSGYVFAGYSGSGTGTLSHSIGFMRSVSSNGKSIVVEANSTRYNSSSKHFIVWGK